MRRSFFLSILIAAVALTGLVWFLFSRNNQFEFLPLFLGNIILALISVLSFVMINRGLKAKSPNAFLRAKYMAMLIKFFLCVGLLVGYIFVEGRENIYKPAIFLLLGMYVVYAALEAIPLSKIAKEA